MQTSDVRWLIALCIADLLQDMTEGLKRIQTVTHAQAQCQCVLHHRGTVEFAQVDNQPFLVERLQGMSHVGNILQLTGEVHQQIPLTGRL